MNFGVRHIEPSMWLPWKLLNLSEPCFQHLENTTIVFSLVKCPYEDKVKSYRDKKGEP